MKFFYLLTILLFSISTNAQSSKISVIDFVQVQNENFEEARFYYENNWKQLRIKAKEKQYIDSYQFLETDYSDDAPFHFIIITTYANDDQFAVREENFKKLIAVRGDTQLMNEKKPGDFRKIIFFKEPVKHLE